MTRIFRFDIVVLLLTCVLVSAPTKAQAQDPTMDIVKKMKEVFEPVRPSTRRVVLTVTSGGETVQFVAGQARKQLSDGKRMIMVLLQPMDLKGNNYLVWEPKDTKPTAVWAWVPFLRRIREFTTVDAYEHYLGSDFTFADLGFVRLHPYYRLLGEEEHGGKQTYKIEETVPKERAYYSRVVTWVDKATLLPVQRDYYDPAGTLWKTETFEVTTINGVPTPIRIVMKDLQAKTSTMQQIDNVKYDVELPDALFDPMKLPVAADSPLWQSSGAQAGAAQ
ncbi:MAG: outer membrane lipoprotein-sorting protein [Deltaproteobacteria bacterium]|nr:outer membrane lipoprotein-sorting protein [Deltaproteobacteria bacterium]